MSLVLAAALVGGCSVYDSRYAFDPGPVDVPVATGRWYTRRVTMVGNEITCSLDGRSMLEATDDTFPQAGMIGLWTKADAVTSFDDLTSKPWRPAH